MTLAEANAVTRLGLGPPKKQAQPSARQVSRHEDAMSHDLDSRIAWISQLGSVRPAWASFSSSAHPCARQQSLGPVQCCLVIPQHISCTQHLQTLQGVFRTAPAPHHAFRSAHCALRVAPLALRILILLCNERKTVFVAVLKPYLTGCSAAGTTEVPPVPSIHSCHGHATRPLVVNQPLLRSV